MQASKSKIWISVFFLIGLCLFVWLNWFSPDGTGEQNPIEAATAIHKEKAADRALEFARDQFGSGEWKAFVTYDAYDDAQGYFTKLKLEEEYDRYWSSSVPADYYRVQVKEELTDAAYSLYVKLENGDVFGWERLDAEEDDDEAHPEQLADAESMVRHMGYDTDQFELAAETQGNEFVFRHKQYVGEAALSLHLRASGESIVSFIPAIELPESFLDWKNSQDDRGAATSTISLLLWFGLAIAAIVYMAVYRATMPFSRGVWLTLAFSVPYLIYNVNLYPGLKLTITGMDDSVIYVVLFSQFLSMLMAASVYVCLVAGDGLWRRMGYELWPHHRDKNFGSLVMRSVGIGYVFCVIILGLQSTLFYVAGELFDVWFGIDPLQSTHNLLWPGLYPLLAWSAAVSEEAVYRLFAIAFFTMLFRPIWRWVSRFTGRPVWLHPLFYLIPAILVANVLWGLGHTGYAVYPVYTRLVEVTLLGFVFSFVFLRYGLIAAMFTHATMDLTIMGLEMMMNDERYIAASFLYMLMPLAVGLFIWLFTSLRTKEPSAATAADPNPDDPRAIP